MPNFGSFYEERFDRCKERRSHQRLCVHPSQSLDRFQLSDNPDFGICRQRLNNESYSFVSCDTPALLLHCQQRWISPLSYVLKHYYQVAKLLEDLLHDHLFKYKYIIIFVRFIVLQNVIVLYRNLISKCQTIRVKYLPRRPIVTLMPVLIDIIHLLPGCRCRWWRRWRFRSWCTMFFSRSVLTSIFHGFINKISVFRNAVSDSCWIHHIIRILLLMRSTSLSTSELSISAARKRTCSIRLSKTEIVRRSVSLLSAVSWALSIASPL
ncbi:hypothetical protein PM082_020814 [Marasmius tenuissimus]|nr:hypothetical protein PM082_020814 [Marasmius tenuissimus]